MTISASLATFCYCIAQVALMVFPFFLGAITIPIRNNSAYTLTAKIISAEGKLVSTSTLEPGSTHIWSDSRHSASDIEKGPFEILLHCPNGDFYGRIFPVNSGLEVSAQSARDGAKRCRKK